MVKVLVDKLLQVVEIIHQVVAVVQVEQVDNLVVVEPLVVMVDPVVVAVEEDMLMEMELMEE